MWDTLQDGVYKSRIQDMEELRYDMLVEQLIPPHGTNN